MIDVSSDHIKYAESILLKDSGKFDDKERVPFIKRFDMIDVQAVPGSGKTTALLAKILILEKHLPFFDGSGILLLSHTNTTVDKIQRDIKNLCPRAFNYPSHIGTIQSFVDKFLAIPYYRNCFNKSPTICEDSYYNHKIEKWFRIETNKIRGSNRLLYNRLYTLWNSNNPFYRMRFQLEAGKVVLVDAFQGQKLMFTKPKPESKNYVDYSEAEKTELYNWALQLKRDLLEKEGILNYDDAYFLANRFIHNVPSILDLLRSRFSHVFIDEMQDMKSHQIDLLEKIFCVAEKTRCFQRIGDINQTIYSSEDFDLQSTWNLEGREILNLSGTHRLCSLTAGIVEKFGLRHIPIESLKSEATEKPKLILFKVANAKKVLPFFASIVQEHKTKHPDLYDGRYPVKAIGWRKTSEAGISIKTYFPDFIDIDASTIKPQSCLWNDLLKAEMQYRQNASALRFIKNGILTSFCRILRNENCENGSLTNTPSRLIKFLLYEHPDFYSSFTAELLSWSFIIAAGEIEEAWIAIRGFITGIFFPLLGLEIHFSKEYCELKFETPQQKPTHYNQYADPETGLNIEISTVHKVKGETHLATLYLETFFYNDGGVSYESQRLSRQFTGSQIELKNIKKRVAQSAKMIYVGFSRPKHLLCFAANADHFSVDALHAMEELGWEIKRDLAS